MHTASAPPAYGTASAPPAYGEPSAPPPSFADLNYVNISTEPVAPAGRRYEMKVEERPQVALTQLPPENVTPPPAYIDMDDWQDEPDVHWGGPGLIGACKRSMHLKSWTVTVIVVCSILLVVLKAIGALHMKSWMLYGLLSLAVISYLFEMFCSSSFWYLYESHELHAVEGIINNIKAATPSVNWHVQCYHFETRYTTRRDSEGRTHRESKRVRVDTWSASGRFNFHSWQDASAPLQGMDDFKLTKLKLKKRFVFANQFTRSEFERQRAHFRQVNKRDVHQDFTQTFNCPGFRSRLLSESVKGYKPWCLNVQFYLFFHLCFLGPCYRWWFSSICGKRRLDIVKIMTCHSRV